MRFRRVFGYARVSSVEQAHGTSLDDQQRAIAAHAKALGLKVTKFFVESESGIHEKIERRREMQALLGAVQSGDLVLCDKIDRWSRDIEFTHRSVRELLAKGASVFFVGDNCDPGTPDGDSMLGIRAWAAREEHKRIKLRMVGTRRLLRNQGYYVEGLPPFGYRRSLPKGHKGLEKNVLVVHDGEAELVRRIHRMCIAGHSLTKIAAALDLMRDRVRDVIRGRFYTGEIQNAQGEWIKGKHPPIIDAATFARAQSALDGRRLGSGPREAPSETSGWLLRDVARCAACGGKMGAAYAGEHEARRYYYRCVRRCTNRYVSVRVVEVEAEPMIVARLEELREELGREPPRPAKVAPVNDFAARRAKVERQRSKYLDAFAEDLMSKDVLRAKIAKLDADALRIDADEQESLRPHPLADAEVRRSMLREVGVISKAWKVASPEARREIVGHLATAVHLTAGKTPRFVWRAPEELTE